jgi:AraC-like DNA-binding protein
MTQMSSATTLVATAEPSSPKPSNARVSVNILRALGEVVQHKGASPDELFGRRAADFYADPATSSLSMQGLEELFDRAVILTGDLALGLHCGLHARETCYGLMSPLVAHAPTLREALMLLTQFHQLLLQDVRVRLLEQSDVAELRLEVAAQPGRHVSEFFVAGLTRTLRAFGCDDRDIKAVCFRHPQPAYHHEYSSAFSGAERFKQSFAGIVFAREALDRAQLHQESDLQKVVLAVAEAKLKQLWRPLTWTEQVQALINNRPLAEISDMGKAARELGMSERSLRRRLDEEGSSYRDLSQTRLQESARAMLRNPALTLQNIAYTLGFADAASFNRAFRRWAGCTPAQFRASFQAQRCNDLVVVAR